MLPRLKIFHSLAAAALERWRRRSVPGDEERAAGLGRDPNLRAGGRRDQNGARGNLGAPAVEFNQMRDQLAEERARREEAEERLRLAEERYHRIFEDSVLGIFQSTPDGQYVSANHVLARLLGYNDAQEFKDAVRDIGAQVYVDPRRRAEFLHLLETQETLIPFETQFRRKDGGACWVSLKARAERDETGKVRFYEGVIEDITQRKRAEDDLRTLSRAVEQSPASIVITDPEGRIEYVNRKFTEISSYTADEALGRKPSVLKSGLMPEEVYRELWQTITGGREWHGELHNRKKTGELYWERALISPILDADGRVTHFLGIKEDITHRKESDGVLRRTMDQLERFNRLAIGREKRIIELKSLVNELLARLGEPPRYQVGLNSASSENEVQILLAGA